MKVHVILDEDDQVVGVVSDKKNIKTGLVTGLRVLEFKLASPYQTGGRCNENLLYNSPSGKRGIMMQIVWSIGVDPHLHCYSSGFAHRGRWTPRSLGYMRRTARRKTR